MKPETSRFQVCTGGETHTTQWRSASVFVVSPKGGETPLYKALTPIAPGEWELVGNKGNHGKWVKAEYDVPVGTRLRFEAKANGRPTKSQSFVVQGQPQDTIDLEGYTYSSRICGWIVAVDK